MSRRIAVLGGGVGGVVVAHDLAMRGAAVDLYERAPALGGLHRSVVFDGDAFDIGVFGFPDDHPLFASFPSLRSRFLRVPSQQLTITPKGSFDTYPVSAGGYLRDHGFAHAARAATSMVAGKFRYLRRGTVADYAKFYVGSVFYEDTGLKNYIERMYGVPDSEVGMEFATQRLGEIRNFIVKQLKNRLHRDPNDSTYLVRPREGFASVYAHIAEELQKSGVNLHCGAELTAVRRLARGYAVEAGASGHEYDDVISTIPVSSLGRLVGQPAQSTEHIGLLSLFYRGDLSPPASVIYNFTLSGKWKRICLFSRYYGASRGTDYFTVEITCRETSDAHRQQMMEDFESHAASHSLFRERPQCVGHIMTTAAYPMFRPENARARIDELNQLRAMGIQLLGRQGAQQYISSAVVAQQARQLASMMQVA